jgi:hypothetical protein
MISVNLPLRTKNPTNNREHWRTVHTRSKKERGTAYMLVKSKLNAAPLFYPPYIQIRLTRLSSGELDDDNLRAALKSVRDGVADAFGMDDAKNSKLKFEYAQEKCKRGAYCVRIEIE